jgi:hypothetical protein
LYQHVILSYNSAEVVKGLFNERFYNWGDAFCSCIEADFLPFLFVYSSKKVGKNNNEPLLSDENIKFINAYLKVSRPAQKIRSKRQYLTNSKIIDKYLDKTIKNEDYINIDIESLIKDCETLIAAKNHES